MIRSLHGDCLELAKSIPSCSVDFICTDLPYGTTQCKWDTPIDLDSFWQQVKRIIKPDGAIALFAQTPFDKVLGSSNLPMLRYEWIWEKTNATGFLNAKKMPLKAHENILVFYKSLPNYNPQKTTGHERKTTIRTSVRSDVYGKACRKSAYDSTERYPRSVIKFSSDKQKFSLHPTQKPVAATSYFISTYTNKGDLVVDFSQGSGTCGHSCIELEREYIGMEKQEKYHNVSVMRHARVMGLPFNPRSEIDFSALVQSNQLEDAA